MACYLNKPEIPVILAGTIATIVNGGVPAIHGLLISSAIGTFYEPPHQLKKDSSYRAILYVVFSVAVFHSRIIFLGCGWMQVNPTDKVNVF